MSQYIPLIETERFILRPFTLEDSAELQALADDFAIADTCQIVHPYTVEEAIDWIGGMRPAFDRREEAVVAITLKDSGMIIGAVTLLAIFENHQAELGFWIGQQFWGRGAASEASRAFMNWGIERFHLIRVHACCFARNGASSHVLKNIGMHFEGMSPKHLLKWGIPEDVEFWGIVVE